MNKEFEPRTVGYLKRRFNELHSKDSVLSQNDIQRVIDAYPEYGTMEMVRVMEQLEHERDAESRRSERTRRTSRAPGITQPIAAAVIEADPLADIKLAIEQARGAGGILALAASLSATDKPETVGRPAAVLLLVSAISSMLSEDTAIQLAGLSDPDKVNELTERLALAAWPILMEYQ